MNIESDIAPETLDVYKMIRAVYMKGYEDGGRDMLHLQVLPMEQGFLEAVTSEVMNASLDLAVKIVKETLGEVQNG